MYNFNSKSESIDILTNYFKKFNNDNILEFLEKNTIDPEYVEPINLLEEHFAIVRKKIFYLTTQFNLVRGPIKISFVKSSIGCTNMFTIDSNIFINYSFLVSVFEKIEYNLYKEVKNVYIDDDKIYDMELLKSISECMYYVLEYLNFDSWSEFIQDRFNCMFVDISDISFTNNYEIYKNPNMNWLWNKMPIYWKPGSIEPYTVINSICSNPSYSPYWETILIELKYSNGKYIEINSKKCDSKLNLSEPFVEKANQITNCIIY